MLTNEQIEINKKEFIDLINSITREFDKDRLIDWLENKSDFFHAPASTRYHESFEGGLCDHSLNVYYSLRNLMESYRSYFTYQDKDGNTIDKYDDDTLKIVGVLHDI